MSWSPPPPPPPRTNSKSPKREMTFGDDGNLIGYEVEKPKRTVTVTKTEKVIPSSHYVPYQPSKEVEQQQEEEKDKKKWKPTTGGTWTSPTPPISDKKKLPSSPTPTSPIPTPTTTTTRSIPTTTNNNNPNDIYGPGDRITCILKKEFATQNSGIVLQLVNHNRIVIKSIKGIAKQRQLPIQIGDQILFLNDKAPHDWKTIDNMNQALNILHIFKLVLIRPTHEPQLPTFLSFLPPWYSQLQYNPYLIQQQQQQALGSVPPQPGSNNNNNKKKRKKPIMKKKKDTTTTNKPKPKRAPRGITVVVSDDSESESDDDDFENIDTDDVSTTSDENETGYRLVSKKKRKKKKNKEPKSDTAYHFVNKDLKRQKELDKKKKNNKDDLVSIDEYLSSSSEEEDESTAMELPANDEDHKLHLNRNNRGQQQQQQQHPSFISHVLNRKQPLIDIKPGIVMEMFNIRKRPDLNGIKVDVLERDEKRPKRWKVDFMRGNNRIILSVADKNLRKPTTGEQQQQQQQQPPPPPISKQRGRSPPRPKEPRRRGIGRSASTDSSSLSGGIFDTNPFTTSKKPIKRSNSFDSTPNNTEHDDNNKHLRTPVVSNKGFRGKKPTLSNLYKKFGPGKGMIRSLSNRSNASSENDDDDDDNMIDDDTIKPGDRMQLKSLRSQPQWNGMDVIVVKKDDLFPNNNNNTKKKSSSSNNKKTPSSRWQVKIISNNEIVSVSKRNLLQLQSPDLAKMLNKEIHKDDMMRLINLRSQPQWNNKVVKVIKKDSNFPNSDRYQVEILDDREIISIKKENLIPLALKETLPPLDDTTKNDKNDGTTTTTNNNDDLIVRPGDRLKLCNLRSQPQWNGKTVKVIKFDDSVTNHQSGNSKQNNNATTTTYERWHVELEDDKEIVSVGKRNLVPLDTPKPSSSSSSSKLKPNEYMKIQNVRSQPQWNNKIVKIIELDPMFKHKKENNNRYKVEILQDKEIISIKRENLYPATSKEINDAKNSTTTTTTKTNTNNDNSSSLEDFIIQKGDTMKLRNLRSQPQWNGKTVRIIKKDDDNSSKSTTTPNNEDNQRWQVEILDDKEIVSVGKKNLIPISSSTSSSSGNQSRNNIKHDDDNNSEMDFSIHNGDIIQLCNLRSQPQWNGKDAKVIKEDDMFAKGDRWQVEILDEKEIVSIGKRNMRKPNNNNKKQLQQQQQEQQRPKAASMPTSGSRPKPPQRNLSSSSSVGSNDSFDSIDSNYTIQIGEKMKLGNLKSQPQWNGKIVKVIKKDSYTTISPFGTTTSKDNNNNDNDKDERWQVQVVGSNELMSVGKKNLFAVKEERKRKMTKKAFLQQQQQQQQKPNNDDEKNNNNNNNDNEDDISKTLTVRPGDMLKLRNLRSQPEWNGRVVEVRKKDMAHGGKSSTSERWEVQILGSNDIVSVGKKNLMPVSSGARGGGGKSSSRRGGAPRRTLSSHVPRPSSRTNSDIGPPTRRLVGRSLSPKKIRSTPIPIPPSSTSSSNIIDFTIGDKYKLINLRSQPQWNGKIVKILGKDKDFKFGDRWQVEILDTHDVLSVPKRNLIKP